MAKKGRKPKRSFITPNGSELTGLVQDSDGRFRPSGRSSPKWSGPWEIAFHKFQVWQSRQANGGELEPLDDCMFFPGDAKNERLKIRDLIATDPKQAAIYLDYPPLAKLANIRDLEPADSKSLIALGDAYLADKKGELTGKEWKNSETWWNEFIAITGAKTISDLDRSAFRKYRDKIKANQKRLSRSNVYTRSRFAKIKTMVSYALNEGDLEFCSEDKRILQDRSILKSPSKPKPHPTDITPKELDAILKAADEWETALILVALNGAYTNIDCRRLQWSMIDWRGKTIRFDRGKSEHLSDASLPRVCALWDRTIQALRAIKNEHKHVFVSMKGQPAHIDTIARRFERCREAAKVKRKLTFKHLRKSSLTAASNDPTVQDRQIDLLAGHSAGIKEHYVVKRNVASACEAIERYYFENSQEGPGRKSA